MGAHAKNRRNNKIMDDATIINKMPKQFVKEDLVIRRSALIALKKARMYDTTLAVDRNGELVMCEPDVFEKFLPEDIKTCGN